MTFLAPAALVIGALAAGILIGLHRLAARTPPPAPLPTARFVPMSEERAVRRAAWPTDLPLLALRLLAIAGVSLAFARPVPDEPGPPVRSVVLLDVSRGVADPAGALREARARLTEGGVLIAFDTSAAEADAAAIERRVASAPVAGGSGGARAGTAAPPELAPARATLSPALVAARRAAARIARGADSVRLVLVSPVARDAFDSATVPLRAAWPGGIEVVRVAGVADTGRRAAPELRSPLADDPLAPALARSTASATGPARTMPLAPPPAGPAPSSPARPAVRIVRDGVSAADSAWSRAAEDRVLVAWPLAADSLLAADAVLATGERASALVAPLARLPIPAGGRVLARWRDGAPAAVESVAGGSCVRHVGIGLPTAGDLTLQPAFAPLLARLVEPCGGARAPGAADPLVAMLRGSAGAARAASLRATADGDAGRALGRWLLLLALVALLAEWALRRRVRS